MNRATGRVFDIKRFAIHDGPGIRTTVFLKGCPLDCPWCHNPESQDARPEVLFRVTRCGRCGACVEACEGEALATTADGPVRDAAACVYCGKCADACPAGAREVAGREVAAEEVVAEIARDLVFYETSGGGATISGGEPLAQPAFLCALLDGCAAAGIATAVDTSGFAPRDVVRDVAGRTGLFLYDLKLVDGARHRTLCGVPNGPILENLRFLSGEGAAVVIRVPLVPGFNDGEADLRELGAFVADLPGRHAIDLLPYERFGLDKYARLGRESALANSPALRVDEVAAAARTLASFDLDVTVKGDQA